jgi:hypothetical protein
LRSLSVMLIAFHVKLRFLLLSLYALTMSILRTVSSI